jgi:hypothetical protein
MSATWRAFAVRNTMAIRLLAYLVTACNLATLAALSWRVASTPENHWGLDHRRLIPLFAAELVVCALPRVRLGRLPRLAVALSSAAALVVVVGFTELNALVPYEVWIRRGMPAKWE